MSIAITTTEVTALINESVKGTTAVSIDTVTEPRLNKTAKISEVKKIINPYYGKGLKKHATINGLIGFDYNNSVNNQADREGKEQREAKPRRWGTLTANRLFVTHKGHYYLQIKAQSSTNVRYVLPDGTEVDVEEIKPFLPKKSKSSTQSDLEKEVIVRDVKMENINCIRFQGEEYDIFSGLPAIPMKKEAKKEATEEATA